MGGNPACSPGPERQDSHAGEAGVDQSQKKIAHSVTGSFGAPVWEQWKKWSGGFPGEQKEKEGERGGGSEKLQIAELVVHRRSLTGYEELEN